VLERRFPGLVLYIVEGMTEELAVELRQGKLDLLIASPSPLLSGFGEIPAFFERFVLCANSGDKIARRKRLRLPDLEALDMLYLGPGHCLADQAYGFCATAGAARSPFQAASLETLRLLVAAGRGAALIPELAVGGAAAGAGGLLSYVPFREKSVGREVTLYHRTNSPFAQDAKILAGMIGECVSALKQPASARDSAML
jgi:LysR family hydrogen peroxide-inducible transcriptional activator